MAGRLDGRDEVVVFDTETTGTSREDRVVSLGMVRLAPNLELIDSLHLVFNPGRPSHPMAQAVHGLSDAYLRRQDPFERHAENILSFSRGAALVAHNLSFDWRMMGQEFERLGAGGFDPAARRFCTVRGWKTRHPGKRGKLDLILAEIGLYRDGHIHGAYEDAVLAAQVLRHLHDRPCFGPVRLIPPGNER